MKELTYLKLFNCAKLHPNILNIENLNIKELEIDTNLFFYLLLEIKSIFSITKIILTEPFSNKDKEHLLTVLNKNILEKFPNLKILLFDGFKELQVVYSHDDLIHKKIQFQNCAKNPYLKFMD